MWSGKTDISSFLSLREPEKRPAFPALRPVEDGALHILCANTSAHSGWEGPSNAAHYRFDGSTLEELASWDYYDEDYKAVPREGGLDLYSFNPQYEFQFHNPDYSGVPLPSQWIYSHFQPLA